jgi:hypothetical protein
LGWWPLPSALGIAHELFGQLFNAFGVGGREQQGLALGRALFGHGGNVVKKAHVQHAVGLVQHQGVEGFQRQVAALQVVHDAPGRAHHHVRAVLQRGTLAAQRNAAAQGDDLDVFLGARQAADFDGHLVGQFARGAQHQACTANQRGFSLASSASAKAAVLPLPVCAWAIRSLPASAMGRLAAWMGVISA